MLKRTVRNRGLKAELIAALESVRLPSTFTREQAVAYFKLRERRPVLNCLSSCVRDGMLEKHWKNGQVEYVYYGSTSAPAPVDVEADTIERLLTAMAEAEPVLRKVQRLLTAAKELNL